MTDAAALLIDYDEVVDEYVKKRGVEDFEDLDEREHDMFGDFDDYLPKFNRLARQLQDQDTTDTQACAILRSMDDLTYDLMHPPHELIIQSGWVYRFMQRCVDRKWWQALKLVMNAYALS
jgi:hypothetical protein